MELRQEVLEINSSAQSVSLRANNHYALGGDLKLSQNLLISMKLTVPRGLSGGFDEILQITFARIIENYSTLAETSQDVGHGIAADIQTKEWINDYHTWAKNCFNICH